MIAVDSQTPDNGSGELVIDEGSFTGTTLPAPAGDLLPPRPERPILQISPGNTDALLQRSQEILSPRIYRRGPELVWIGAASELPRESSLKSPIRRADDQRSIIRVTVGYVVAQLSKLADVQRYDGRSKSWCAADWPDRLARTLIDYQNWPQLRPLDAIVRAPFVRADGTVCDEPGYDPQSRCFYDPITEYPSLPETVSVEDAHAALMTLRTPFDQFPWKTRAAESAFIAHIITEAARLAIDTCPLIWYTAGPASSGKTLLSRMAACIVHGEAPAMRPWVGSKDDGGAELRKTLYASLLAGDRSIAFDNVPSGHKARAPELCAFLTSDTWQDRKLGVSETQRLPQNAVVTASGNNVSPAGDLARRSLVVRLDADTPDLAGRTFRIADLHTYVKAHRVPLLMAALTIIRGHQQSGHVGPTPLPSFVQWSRMVRDALLWLGMPDPLETQSETENDAPKLGDAFNMLASIFNGMFTAGDLAAHMRSICDMDGKLTETLREAGCSDARDSTRVAYWLREQRDQFGGNWKLEQTPGSATHAKKYRFKHIAGTKAPVPANDDLIGREQK